MICTEEEAKTKTCCGPIGVVNIIACSVAKTTGGKFQLAPGRSDLGACIGSACMAWRWDNGADFRLSADAAFKRTGERIKPTRGFCGLAGRSE